MTINTKQPSHQTNHEATKPPNKPRSNQATKQTNRTP
jgi:hypothetical protein